MADSKEQDLSALVSRILEHPQLVSQITQLLSESGTKKEETEEVGVIEEVASAQPPPIKDKQENRKRLLSALRPFLSERRRGALDSLETVATLLEITRA